MLYKFNVDKTQVRILETRDKMGVACATEAGKTLRKLLEEKDEVNIVFASSPSQLEMLNCLAEIPDIDWSRVNVFHMDEYIGIGIEEKQSFGNYIRENFFFKLKFKNIFYINGLASDPKEMCEKYSKLLTVYPTDIAFVGIGENGHLAFNDPHIANFFDEKLVKINHDLDDKCRQQQVTDEWFNSIDEVPDSAITISLYGLLKATYMYATVPGATKKEVVKCFTEGMICTACPATGMRLHDNSFLYLDKDSASLLSVLNQ